MYTDPTIIEVIHRNGTTYQLTSEIVPQIGSWVSFYTSKKDDGEYMTPTERNRLITEGRVYDVAYEYGESGHSTQSASRRAFASVFIEDGKEPDYPEEY